jgi:hypothetical protein
MIFALVHLRGRPGVFVSLVHASRRTFFVILGVVILGVVISAALPCIDAFAQSDPLPSWNDGAAKKSIIDFVARVTARDGPDFVAAPQRIATFDNDGTLWCEQPALLDKDMKALAASGEKGLLQIMAATHAGMTTDEFSKTVLDWTGSARHPRFNRPYTDLVYQPI